MLYAATIVLSAFLLFQVQPLIAKNILPWFGGSAAVWSTCLAFFQIVLVFGYLYATRIRRLAPRRQTFVHVTLLAASALFLPIVPDAWWNAQGVGDPTLRILGLLTATVGLPYFLLSTTGPLLQAWYADVHPSRTPYRLYALSNVGSLLALLTYPIVVEPIWGIRQQALGWSGLYVGFVLLCVVVAVAGRATAADHVIEATDAEAMVTWRSRVLWFVLPACASTLLLAVTSHLTQDVAPVPFLWILPLTVYLLSFVLCFESGRWYRRWLWVPLTAAAVAGLSYGIFGSDRNAGVPVTVAMVTAAYFACCMFCHGELARLRPPLSRLTTFYLLIAAGGAAGGIFVGLLAPQLFGSYLEYPIGLLLTAALLVVVTPGEPRRWARVGRWNPLWLALVGTGVATAWYLGQGVRDTAADARVMVRNFYGVLRVSDEETTDGQAVRELTHGRVIHGAQYLDPLKRGQPTTYFGPRTAIGMLLEDDGRRIPRRVGIVGLGAGTLAAYGRAGDDYRFYEINPLVIQLARREFTYLADSQAQIDIVEGDGRLSLEHEPSEQFDVLAMDAFSGDSIPVHLVTQEALGLYFRHLKPSGVLAVQLSNKYLDLAPVVRAAAETLGKEAVAIESEDDQRDEMIFGATWMLVADPSALDARPGLRQAAEGNRPARPAARAWTDNYSNLWRVLR